MESETFSPVPPRQMCRRHPENAAAAVCASCGAPCCVTCVFPRAHGAHLCPECAQANPAALPPRLVDPAAPVCSRHPSVPAILRCDLCGTFCCATCGFEFDGGIHLCPTCATNPDRALSPRRRTAMYWSFGLAAFASVAFAAVLAGAFAFAAQDAVAVQALGFLFMVIVLLPSAVGMAMGWGAIDRRYKNPTSLWVAAIWNTVVAALFLLTCIVGMVRE